MFCLQEREYLGTVVVHFLDSFFSPLSHTEKGNILLFKDWIRVQKFLSHSSFISKVLLLA